MVAFSEFERGAWRTRFVTVIVPSRCGCEAWELPRVAGVDVEGVRDLVMFMVRVWVQDGPYVICEVVNVDGCGCEKGEVRFSQFGWLNPPRAWTAGKDVYVAQGFFWRRCDVCCDR